MTRAGYLGILTASTLATFLLGARPATANTFTVMNLNDSGTGSLRAAVSAAQANADADIINFAPGLTGTIVLTSGELVINRAVSINGPGAAVLAVSGNNASRVFGISSSVISISGLTVENGNNKFGAGIFKASGTLSVTDCLFTGNVAGGPGIGGAGGGILTDNSPTTVTRTLFIDNFAQDNGGGLSSVSATTVVNDCTFINNRCNGTGGGLLSRNGVLKLTGGVFQRNSASQGGGVCIENSDTTLTNCQIEGNSAARGGGISNVHKSLNATNLLLAGNTASNAGGGVFTDGAHSTTLANCTVIANSAAHGGGVEVKVGSFTASNSILFGNTSPDGSQIRQNSGTVMVSYSDVQGGWSGTSNINQNPLFVRNPSPGPDGMWDGVNDDYGDLRLQASSPCRDQGSDPAIPADTADLDADLNTTEPTPFDLDGNLRVRGAGVDLGAYEFQALEATVIRALPNPATRTYLFYVQVKNYSPDAILGPVSLAVEGMPAGLFLTNATGINGLGFPYVTAYPAGGSLAPEQSMVLLLRITSPIPLATLPDTVHLVAKPGPG